MLQRSRVQCTRTPLALSLTPPNFPHALSGKAPSNRAAFPPAAQTVPGRFATGRECPIFLENQGKNGYIKLVRLPSGLSVGTAQTEKGGLAMRKIVFALFVAMALVLLLTSDVR